MDNWDQKAAYGFLHRTMKGARFQTSYALDQAMSSICAVSLPEIFSPALILDLLMESELHKELRRNLLQLLQNAIRKEDGLCAFLINRNTFPPDVDNTSLVHAVLAKSKLLNPQKALQAVKIVIANTNSKGLIKTWISLRPNQVDPVVCANALYFIYSQGKGFSSKPTEDFLYQILTTSDYPSKKIYFPSEDIYLYYLSRLFEFPDLRNRFYDPLNKRLEEKRTNITENPIDLAARIICSKKLKLYRHPLELPNELEERKLARLQEEDGGWPCWALAQSGLHNFFSGSRQLTTAFAIRALQE